MSQRATAWPWKLFLILVSGVMIAGSMAEPSYTAYGYGQRRAETRSTDQLLVAGAGLTLLTVLVLVLE